MTSYVNGTLKQFRIEDVDLERSAVLEASAGTGKTYSLTGMVVRLLIGHKCIPLDIENILLVTFTDAAASDLRRKVLEKIQSVRETFELALLLESDNLSNVVNLDDFACTLLESLFDGKKKNFTSEIKSNLNKWINLLKIAENKIDKASISTIHSFCQNMLKRNAFESGVLFKNKFVDDENDIIHQALFKEIRKEFYRSDLNSFEREIFCVLSDPENYIEVFKNINRADEVIAFKEKSETDIAFKFAELTSGFQSVLKNFFSVYRNLFADSEEFDRCFSIIEQTKLIELYNICDTLKKFIRFSHKKLDAAPATINPLIEFCVSVKMDFPLHEVETTKLRDKNFFDSDKLTECLTEYSSLISEKISLWCKSFFEKANLRKEQIKKLKNVLSFDDLITNLRDAVQESVSGKNTLIAKIRDLYPVAMIDEFQDTDKAQYDIFYNIYLRGATKGNPIRNRDDYICSLFLIGDPKQSIYRFRNADINTYFYARKKNSDIADGQFFNMDTNYRSDPRTVLSVNALFRSEPTADPADERNVFRTPEIKFTEVNSREKGEELVWNNNGSVSPVTPVIYTDVHDFIDDESVLGHLKKAEQTRILSNICAFQLHELLTKAAFRDKGSNSLTPLKLSDFAILVSREDEAASVRSALLEYGIKSVYLSSRENVRAVKLENEFMKNYMSALLYIRDFSRVRKLIVDPLLNLSLKEIHKLITDSQSYDKFLNLAGRCRLLWEKRGFLASFYCFINDPSIELFKRLRSFDDGEQRITNIMQIAEIIQENEDSESSPQAVYSDFCKNTAEEGDDSENGDRNKNELRLDSEDDLVSIVTIFKSKGLEYKIVLLPFIGLEQAMEYPVCYHEQPDPADGSGRFEKDQSISKLNILGVNNFDKIGKKGMLNISFSSDNSSKSSNYGDAPEKTYNEVMQEKIRLLYVAVTRARFCNCFAISAGTKFGAKKAELSGFKRNSILGAALQGKYELNSSEKNAAAPVQRGKGKKKNENIQVLDKTLSELWRCYLETMDEVFDEYRKNTTKTGGVQDNMSALYSSLGDISSDYNTIVMGRKFVMQNEGGDADLEQSEKINSDCYGPAVFNEHIDRTWAVTSYSNLVARGVTKSKKFEVNSAGSGNNEELSHEGEGQNDDQGAVSYIMNQFSFPKGSKPGDFLHNMMEKRDFQHQLDEGRALSGDPLFESLEDYIKRIVTRSFFANSSTLRHWREPQGIGVLAQWFRNIVDTPLVIGENTFVHLSDIPMNHRLSEAEFTFRLGNITGKEINEFFTGYYRNNEWLSAIKKEDDNNTADTDDDGDPLNRFTFDRVTGLLTGKIDLIFFHNGKYYIVDYKSNHLGDGTECYSRENMAKAVAEHRYDFQYSIYALALYRYLKTKIKNLDFSSVFGGVIYLFLRGCNPANPVIDVKCSDSLGNKQIYGCFDVKLPHVNQNNDFIEKLDNLFGAEKENGNDQL